MSTLRSTLLTPLAIVVLTGAVYAQAPVADFSGTPLTGVAPLTVDFTDLSSGGTVDTWAWDFGDGGTSTVQNPSHTYTAAGLYTVSLTASGPGGSDTATKIDYITVSEPPPVAAFSGTPTAGVAPLAVSFTDASTGAITSWAWDFGDTGTSTLQNPSHTYTTPGTYTVALTVTGPGGSDTSTLTNYVTVAEPPPVAAFSGTPTSGNAPLAVSFTDLSTGAVTSWAWDFGDGATSTAQNPSHTYTSAGTYTVALTVTGPGGSDTSTQVDYITVNTAGPVADFSGTPTNGVAPLAVTFTDLSTGSITSWAWDFGDGATSTAQNPSHTYTSPGVYTVALTVTGPGGSNTLTEPNYVTVNAPPTADFTGTPTSGGVPLAVAFTDLSTGTITSRSWNFGDGATSTLQNPSHTYTSVGVYTVSLTVSGPAGSDTHTEVDYITVVVNAEFVGTPTSGFSPLLVTFTDQSQGNITSWAWNFGDGGTSTARNPTHTYTGSGTFTVSLTVDGPDGPDTETKVDYVTLLEPPPVADFSGTPTTGDAPLEVNFLDLSTGNVTSWAWDFGDGGSSTAENPVYTYATPGTYTVSLTATSSGGSDTRTKVDYVTVDEPPLVADFTGTPTTGVAPLTVDFTDTSTGTITSWAWDFGDGGTSTAQNPSHTYAASGLYTVSLTVTGTLGTDSVTKVDYITANDPPPTADFIGVPTSGIAPLTVAFTDLSTGTITSRLWTFGDGTTSTHQNPTHLYSTPGTYTVMLTVSGPSGSTSATKFNYITVNWPAPVANFTGTPTTGFAPLQVSFTDTSVGNVATWAWLFGDGGTSNVENPIHVYPTPGIYNVRLTVTGPGGSDVELKNSYVTVTEPPPIADFSADPTFGEAPLLVTFTDLSTGNITNWSWNFGDGTSSTQQDPTHTYVAPGLYTVSLSTSGPGGSDTETKVDYVQIESGIADPSFEEQTPGAPPAAPWSVTFGTGHVIDPTVVTEDQGLPSHGANWCEVSAAGTDDATPPSNPGGAGSPPVGGAGISQVFVYPAGRPVLTFEAAFLRNEEASQPVHNDWMSVDVTDGSTTHNLFYRDTFSPATETSVAYGWAMSAVETVAADLSVLFPASTPTTLLTITIQAGNGGDAIQPSGGYVDDFRFLEPAAFNLYGCGVNPAGSMNVLAGEPRLGSTMVLGIDNPLGTQSIGSIPLVALSAAAWPIYPCGIPLNGFGMNGVGELLIRPGPYVLKPLLIGSLWTGPGNPAPVNVPIPGQGILAGYSIYAQGLMLDLSAGPGGVRFGLSDAVRLILGP